MQFQLQFVLNWLNSWGWAAAESTSWWSMLLVWKLAVLWRTYIDTPTDRNVGWAQVGPTSKRQYRRADVEPTYITVWARAVVMPTLSPLVALGVVVMTNCGVNKVGNMVTIGLLSVYIPQHRTWNIRYNPVVECVINSAFINTLRHLLKVALQCVSHKGQLLKRFANHSCGAITLFVLQYSKELVTDRTTVSLASLDWSDRHAVTHTATYVGPTSVLQSRRSDVFVSSVPPL